MKIKYDCDSHQTQKYLLFKCDESGFCFKEDQERERDILQKGRGWTLRLVLKNFVLDTSWTKISLYKTPRKKLKFKNSRTGFGQKILLWKNDAKIQRIFCRNTAEFFCPWHVQDKNFKDKPGTDRIRTKSRIDPRTVIEGKIERDLSWNYI